MKQEHCQAWYSLCKEICREASDHSEEDLGKERLGVNMWFPK